MTSFNLDLWSDELKFCPVVWINFINDLTRVRNNLDDNADVSEYDLLFSPAEFHHFLAEYGAMYDQEHSRIKFDSEDGYMLFHLRYS